MRNGTRFTVWNTKPMCSLRNRVSSLEEYPVMSSPPTITCPLVGVSSPPAIEMSVVLPEPDGPTSASISSSPRVSDAWPTATISSSPDW